MAKTPTKKNGSSANLGFEAKLWLAVDKLPTIGKNVDDTMDALERDNPRFKGALNKDHGRADLDKHRLGELINAAAFTRIIQPMRDRIHANLRQSRTLATLRDTLLSKLLSGKLQVRDTERFIKKATP